jgi:hypothetical protein
MGPPAALMAASPPLARQARGRLPRGLGPRCLAACGGGHHAPQAMASEWAAF